ncbi:MAG: hypothetical protein AAF481_08750 [Acidobacteriota bacterium]
MNKPLPMPPDSTPRNRRGLMVAGAVVVTVAIWLLLDALGVGVPSLKRFWPAFVLVGGLASVVDFLVGSRRPASLGRGVAGIGFAVLFFALTYGRLSWRPLLDWLPGLPLVAGLALIATWLAGRGRRASLMASGLILTGVGVSGFAARFDWLERLLPSPVIFWAVLLLVVGLFMIWRAVRSNRRKA